MADNKTFLGSTKNGKDIYAVPMNNRSLMKIQLGQGGKVPEELIGAFSSITYAQDAVDKYLANHKPRKQQKKDNADSDSQL